MVFKGLWYIPPRMASMAYGHGVGRYYWRREYQHYEYPFCPPYITYALLWRGWDGYFGVLVFAYRCLPWCSLLLHCTRRDIRRVQQAGRSTPSTAYLAIDTAHGRYAAFYDCHGSPQFICFGALAMRRTSSLQEKHQLSQVPEILIYPRLLPDTIMAAITVLGESNQLATSFPSSHLKVFKVSPIVLEMSLPGSPDASRGSPDASWGSPEASRG
eukprot:6175347-Pleurochrysis_carterae.AAC.2